MEDKTDDGGKPGNSDKDAKRKQVGDETPNPLPGDSSGKKPLPDNGASDSEA